MPEEKNTIEKNKEDLNKAVNKIFDELKSL